VTEIDKIIIAYVFAGWWNYISLWAIFPFVVGRLAQINFWKKKNDIRK
jgi:hypothetical protein